MKNYGAILDLNILNVSMHSYLMHYMPVFVLVYIFVPFLVCCGGQRKLYAVFKIRCIKLSIILSYLIHLTKENNKIFQEDRMKNNMLLINCKYSY